MLWIQFTTKVQKVILQNIFKIWLNKFLSRSFDSIWHYRCWLIQEDGAMDERTQNLSSRGDPNHYCRKQMRFIEPSNQHWRGWAVFIIQLKLITPRFRYARSCGSEHAHTSAKTGVGVKETFTRLAASKPWL